MVFIEPLALETWVINIFSGSNAIFTAIFIFFITSLAGFFRMTKLTFLIMGITGVLMFSSWLQKDVVLLIITIIALLSGLWIGRLVKR